MSDLISRQVATLQEGEGTTTDILSEIQRVRNSIPDFCPSDWELHMSEYDLRRLRKACEYTTTNTENCFWGLTIIVDDRVIKPTLMPKTDWSLIEAEE